jgi:subtilisin family serine protease
MKKSDQSFDVMLQIMILCLGYGIYAIYHRYTARCTAVEACVSELRVRYHIPEMITNYRTKVVVIDTGFDPILSNKYKTLYNHKGQHTEHGTNVAGIVLGVNSNIELILIAGGDNNIVNSIKIALEQKPDIINISLNSKGSNLEEASLIKNNPNVLFITAMGNDGYKFGLIDHYPAAYEYDNMLRVASLDENHNLLQSSNFGSDLDSIGFLGKNICSFGYCLTGTSQATPFITGMASIIKGRNKDITIKGLKSELRKYTRLPNNHYFGYVDLSLLNIN